MEPIRLYIGWDHRESVGGHVFIQSLIQTTNYPVALTIITPEMAETLAPTDGSNAFTKARFLVPWLCGFHGTAIFLDGADMLLRTTLAELWALRSLWHGVQVVKHNYRTKTKRKYIGTALESDNQDYGRKNWSSCIIWNCDFYPHRKLTPEFVASQPGSYLHRFGWMSEDRIGDLPVEWNHVVGELAPNDAAKLSHFSLGIPGFEHYRHVEHADEWNKTLERAMNGNERVIQL